VGPGAAKQHRRAAVAAMSGGARRETGRERTTRELHELIAALDRRVPQIERAGEDGDCPRQRRTAVAALRRIEELNATVSCRAPTLNKALAEGRSGGIGPWLAINGDARVLKGQNPYV
jgi:hypothetical protein